MVRRIASLLLAVALIGAPTSGRADDASEAKEAFLKGKRFFEAEEFEAARTLFERAYELSGHRPSTIFALAQCERSLKNYDRAIALFEEYLATDPPDAESVRETVKLLKEVQALQEEEEEAAPPPLPMPETGPGEPRIVDAEPATAAPVQAQAPSEKKRKSVFASPWFWVATAAVAGGVATAVILASSQDAEVVGLEYGGQRGILIEF